MSNFLSPPAKLGVYPRLIIQCINQRVFLCAKLHRLIVLRNPIAERSVLFTSVQFKVRERNDGVILCILVYVTGNCVENFLGAFALLEIDAAKDFLSGRDFQMTAGARGPQQLNVDQIVGS